MHSGSSAEYTGGSCAAKGEHSAVPQTLRQATTVNDGATYSTGQESRCTCRRLILVRPGCCLILPSADETVAAANLHVRAAHCCLQVLVILAGSSPHWNREIQPVCRSGRMHAQDQLGCHDMSRFVTHELSRRYLVCPGAGIPKLETALKW